MSSQREILSVVRLIRGRIAVSVRLRWVDHITQIIGSPFSQHSGPGRQIRGEIGIEAGTSHVVLGHSVGGEIGHWMQIKIGQKFSWDDYLEFSVIFIIVGGHQGPSRSEGGLIIWEPNDYFHSEGVRIFVGLNAEAVSVGVLRRSIETDSSEDRGMVVVLGWGWMWILEREGDIERAGSARENLEIKTFGAIGVEVYEGGPSNCGSALPIGGDRSDFEKLFG